MVWVTKLGASGAASVAGEPTRANAWGDLLAPRTFVRVAYRSVVIALILSATAVRLATRRRSHECAQRVGQRTALRILQTAGVRVLVEGEPRAAPGLVVCNHRSYIDVLVLLATVPCTFLCKREVGRWPLIGIIAERMRVVFVDRRDRQSRRESLDRVVEAVMEGRTVATFPEGTTTRGPGMQATRPGLFCAAEQHGFRVIPMVVEYADRDDAWVADDTLFRHCVFWLAKPTSTVALSVGPSLRATESSSTGLRRQVEIWMGLTLARLNALLDRERSTRS